MIDYQDVSQEFYIKNDGFNGHIKGYIVNVKEEKFKHFLSLETDDNGKLYQLFNHYLNHILVIKHIYVEESYRRKGYGCFILNHIIKKYDIKAAILIADVDRPQINHLDIEKFYNANDFFTIDEILRYPIMLYPSMLAKQIIKIK